MIDGLWYAVLYGFLLAFAVGPVFFTLLETSITKGFKAGLFFDLGAIFADIIFIVIAYFSTSKILDNLRDEPGLLVFGGAVLITYGLISYVRTARSFVKIAREHYSVTVKMNLPSLFVKGFLLNFVNFGVLAGWIGTIIFANALTTSKQGVIVFLATVIGVFLTTDLLKISLAKNLRSKMTPRVIYNTKKFVSVTIIIFGALLLIQGIFPEDLQHNIPSISNDIEQKK